MIQIPLYIFLFALFPVTILYISNADQTTFDIVWPALVFVPLLFGLMCLIIKKASGRCYTKAGLLTAPLMFIFFSFGHIYGAAYGPLVRDDKTLNIPFFGPLPLAGFAIGLIIMTLMFWLYAKLARKVISLDLITSKKIHTLLNAMSVFLMLMQPVTYFFSRPNVELFEQYAAQIFPSPEIESLNVKAGDDSLPDIYFIVPDGYARNDFLKSNYKFDNKEFTESLISEGFQVAEKSFASFYWTYLSLGAALNMYPVNEYSTVLGESSKDRTFPYYMVRNNVVLRYLKTLGYDYYQTSSTWGATLVNPFATKVLPCQRGGLFQKEYYRVLVETSLLRPFLTSVGTDLATCHLNNFKSLVELSETKSENPRFVFTHIVPPHHPYLFDRDGNILRFATVANQFDFQAGLWEHKDAYIDQLIFINKKMLEVVRAIKQNSQRPVIIVIASDHGPHLKEIKGDDGRRARLSTFTSVYSSNPKFKLPDPIDLPNLFRSIFIQEFGAQMELLPQRSFFSPYGRPYRFREIEIPEFKQVAK
jgi:hypothetical protein